MHCMINEHHEVVYTHLHTCGLKQLHDGSDIRSAKACIDLAHVGVDACSSLLKAWKHLHCNILSLHACLGCLIEHNSKVPSDAPPCSCGLKRAKLLSWTHTHACFAWYMRIVRSDELSCELKTTKQQRCCLQCKFAPCKRGTHLHAQELIVAHTKKSPSFRDAKYA